MHQDDLGRAQRHPPADEAMQVAHRNTGAHRQSVGRSSSALVSLDVEGLDRALRDAPEGESNVQDVYPLSPLQEGMLFHHLLNEKSDSYVLQTLLLFESREHVDSLIRALQAVIDRHDALRSAIRWEGLARPLQIVHRQVTLPIEELALDSSRDALEQMQELMTPGRQTIDLRCAPLMKLQIAGDTAGRWYALLHRHHIVFDHESWNIAFGEALSIMQGRAELPIPQPYRAYVEECLAQPPELAEAFFRAKLGDIEEAPAPFGLAAGRATGLDMREARGVIDVDLSQRIRARAQACGVSAARLLHAAWGLVVALTSGRDDVVFGTVLLDSERRRVRAQHMVGLFVNTLPLRLKLQGISAAQLIEQVDEGLKELLTHQQSSLALAQRCSGLSGSAPLLTSVLNYRYSAGHSVVDQTRSSVGTAGVRVVAHQYRTNYPIGLTVDNLGDAFALIAQTETSIDPNRVLEYLQHVLRELLDALENDPGKPALSLLTLPEKERRQVVVGFNADRKSNPQGLVHESIEAHAGRSPERTAIACGEHSLSYAELNRRANRVAQALRACGVRPDDRVALCVERGVEAVIGLLAILKAGGAYVPLDPQYPTKRLTYMLDDSAPVVLLTQEHIRSTLPTKGFETVLLDEPGQVPFTADDVNASQLGLHPHHLAYVIYTSGSTGVPKGVMIEHRSLANLVRWHCRAFDIHAGSRVSSVASLSFDAATWEIWPPLSVGATLVLAPPEVTGDADALLAWWSRERLDVSFLPTPIAELAFTRNITNPGLRTLLVGGDRLRYRPIRQPFSLVNNYGPTESTVVTTSGLIEDEGEILHIGRPITNIQAYVLNSRLQPVPVGVPGEIHIGGVGVARGYLNRPELTSERFIPDPFAEEPAARMYKSGDLGRWLDDGTLEYLGRNDDQVKVRGLRIELGEIDRQLLAHPCVSEAVVQVQQDEAGDKRLVAYVVPDHAELKAMQRGGAARSEEIVDHWQGLYEETYSAGPDGPSFIGWNSSYTGQPIPLAAMQEWRDCAVARIRALRPTRVLEIGCGVGLLLQHLAPECAAYVGTDISASALERLERWMQGQEQFAHVRLLHGSATNLMGLQPGSFDTVVMNSVIQYFPDIDYLVAVLKRALRLLTPGGAIFLGDVRNLESLTLFHSAVQLERASASVSLRELRSRIERAIEQDKELVIDPTFFAALRGRLQGLADVQVLLKRGTASTEMTRHRYDVVLHVGDEPGSRVEFESVGWGSSVSSVAQLESMLEQKRWRAARIRNIPNARIAVEAATKRMIESSDPRLEVNAARRELSELRVDALDPQEFWALHGTSGYEVAVMPGKGECFDVQLLDRGRCADARVGTFEPPREPKPWSEYANDPLGNASCQQLIPRLREHLQSRLPDFMIPSAWVLLRQLPLTLNGKLDRLALPKPQTHSEQWGEYVRPRTDLERALAEIWTQLLRVDRVGVHDNFFELGGHSLLATQVLVRIKAALSIDVPLRLLFEQQTIAGLAARLEELRREHLLSLLADGDDEAGAVLEDVSAMSEDHVSNLLQELRTGAQP
jgi:amino acid adenylation domain-containing protein